jgi:DSF synthase
MNSINQSSVSLLESNLFPYTQLTTYYDEKYSVAWYYMNSSPRPCFTPTLLEEIKRFHDDIMQEINNPKGQRIDYLVLASDVPGVFNLGGDLQLFRTLILNQDREALYNYANSCIDAVWRNITNLGSNLTTISLVQGDALGGGFEAALSSDIIIAERSAKLGFPEILFNLFPGMGAYSLLSRKLSGASAEKIILSGKVYTAEELYELGIVDILADDMHGDLAVYDYIKKENKSRNGYRALRAARNCVHPITYEELMKITRVWVDAALCLEPRDLRMMERLICRQSRRRGTSRDIEVVSSPR